MRSINLKEVWNTEVIGTCDKCKMFGKLENTGIDINYNVLVLLCCENCRAGFTMVGIGVNYKENTDKEENDKVNVFDVKCYCYGK